MQDGLVGWLRYTSSFESKKIVKAKHILFFVLVYCCLPIFAQANKIYDVKEIVHCIDSVLLQQKNQIIHYNWASQPVNTKKIFKAKINLNITKEKINKDSLVDFVLEDLGFYHQIFQDTNIYFVNNEKKLIEVNSFNHDDFPNTEQFLRSNCLVLFKPFIRNTFHPSGLPLLYRNQTACDTVIDNKNLIYLCFSDSSEDLTYDSIEVWIDHQFKYYKLRNSYLDNLATEPAFREFNNITYLSGSAITPKVFLDSLLKNSYTLIYKKQEDESEVNNTDTIITSLEFELRNGKSEVYNYNKLQSRYVIIEFANINCAFCFKSIPLYNRLTKNKNIQALWIDSYDGNQKEYAEELYRKKNVVFTVLYDDGQRILKQFKVNLFPTTFIIDRQTNKILKRVNGYSDNIEQIINEVIPF